MYVLDRVGMVGLSPKIPNILLSYIARCQGMSFETFDREQMLIELENSSFKTDSLSEVARWINQNHVWTFKSLIEAYRFLISSETSSLIGPCTPDFPRSMDLCKIYPSISEYCSIDTTEDEMYDIYRYSLLSETHLQGLVRSLIPTFSKKTLINFIKTHTRPSYTPSKEKLESSFRKLSDKKFLLSNIYPTKHEMAIGLASINFGLDISKSTDPLFEYENIRSNPKSRTLYLNLRKQFSSDLPESCYSEEILDYHLSTFGIEIKTNKYKKLVELFEKGTFQPFDLSFNSTTTVTFENASNDPTVVVYGCRDEYFVTTLAEMNLVFECGGNFTFEPIVFDEPNLNRLVYCNPAYRELVDRIQLHHEQEEKQITFMGTKYKSLLIKLLHLGMYMRGWDGLGPFPELVSITSEETFNKISINITELVHQIKSDERYDEFKKLSAYTYNVDRYVEKSYIGIVIQNVERREGCIRLASNVLCFTANRYLVLTGCGSYFDPNKLRHIS